MLSEQPPAARTSTRSQSKRWKARLFTPDEGIRHDASPESIGAVKLLREGGSFTAVTSSQICDDDAGVFIADDRALAPAGLTIGKIDLYEVNEAFAPIPLSWLQTMGADPFRLNVRGLPH